MLLHSSTLSELKKKSYMCIDLFIYSLTASFTDDEIEEFFTNNEITKRTKKRKIVQQN